MKRILLAFLFAIFVVACLSFSVGALTYGDLEYKISDNQITITDCNTSATYIEIPSEIRRIPVTKIGDSAFAYCNKLSNITIPNSVTSIGDYAFLLSSIESITIPGSVTSIGYCSFATCPNLTSVVIQNGVKSIGAYAFSVCEKLSSVVIPGSVTKFGNAVFSGCSNLTSVTLSNGLTSLGLAMFYKCTSLPNITIPESVTSIENLVFYGCDSLTSIRIPKNTSSIGNGAFGLCGKLTNISVDADNPYYYSDIYSNIVCKVDSKLIYSRTGTIPGGLTTIGQGAFFRNQNITIVNIPDGVTTIEPEAFYGCSNLATVSIPNSVTAIGKNAFLDCNNLTIECYYGSFAQDFAKQNNIPYVLIQPTVTIPEFNVTLNGMVLDNKNAQYPAILYNNITYFPMTYFDSRLMGLTTEYSIEKGLRIKQSTEPFARYETITAATPNSGTYTATTATFKIKVNGKNINNAEEYYPLLLFRDVTYFPLTWRFAVEEFGWTYNFDLTNGLVITK